MIIALYSYGQRAGKNTAALYAGTWCIDRSVPFVETSFAAKGKMLAALALGHSSANEGDWETAIEVMDDFKLHGRAHWWTDGREPNDHTRQQLGGREFIINLLEGARELFGRDFWTDRMVQDLPEVMDGCVMVTDLRRDWEADSIHEMGGMVVEIRNPRAVNAGTRVEEGIPATCIDHVIHNTGDLAAYRTAVYTFMDHIKPRL